jgi:hypothetical protein
MNPRHAAWRLAGLGGLLAVLALGGLGCDKDPAQAPGEDEAISQTESINDPYGGYNTSDEIAGFGDEYLLSAEGEAAFDDAVADDPEVRNMLGVLEAHLYGVRLTWGYLERDSSHSDAVVDWSGGADVDTGAVIAVRTIAFEPFQGDQIEPRVNRRELDWTSHTTTGFDGVQLLVVDPTQGAGPLTFHVAAGVVEASFELAQLADLDSTIVVDAEGHEFRIESRRLELTLDCRRGWTSGRWDNLRLDPEVRHTLSVGVLGRFRGHWVTDRGDLAGYLHGFYGVNRRGHQVLFGKVIGSNGRFMGLLRGTWLLSPHSPGTGVWKAHWLDASREVIGGMRGVWERRDVRGAGFFHGAWATGCDSEEAQVEIDPSIF